MTTKATLLNVKFIFISVLFISVLFTNCKSYSQTSIISSENKVSFVALEDEKVTVTSTREVSLETNFNFVSWFMGKKQTVKDNVSQETTSTKKLLINSGVAPNKLLMKAFLKKAQNLTSSVA
jgi:hypothetical protein